MQIHRLLTLTMIFMAACQLKEVSGVQGEIKHHIYLQNRGSVEYEVSIYLDQKSVFKGRVPATQRMPPVVKTIEVGGFEGYKTLTAVIAGQSHSKKLTSGVVDIVVNLQMPENPIWLYYEPVRLM